MARLSGGIIKNIRKITKPSDLTLKTTSGKSSGEVKPPNFDRIKKIEMLKKIRESMSKKKLSEFIQLGENIMFSSTRLFPNIIGISDTKHATKQASKRYGNMMRSLEKKDPKAYDKELKMLGKNDNMVKLRSAIETEAASRLNTARALKTMKNLPQVAKRMADVKKSGPHLNIEYLKKLPLVKMAKKARRG